MDRPSTAPPDTDRVDLSRAVIEAVSDAEATDPANLDYPLYDVIDPSALNALFHGSNGDSGTVEFPYHGYLVTVTSDGEVTLDGQAG